MSATHRISRTHHRPAPPIATAKESLKLILRPHAFFNQLLHFNQPLLIVRTEGFSICQKTEFGVFFRAKNPAFPSFTDPVSGLTVDTREVTEICFFQPQKGPPTFEIHFSEVGFAVAIQPDQSEYSRKVIERIATSFFGEVADTADLISRGTGALLDEWGHVSGHGSISGNRDQISAQAVSTGFSLTITGEISADYPDGGTHRISMKDSETVIFAREHCFTKP